MGTDRLEKLEVVALLAQGLVDTHQIIEVGTHETACVRKKDIERLGKALEDLGRNEPSDKGGN